MYNTHIYSIISKASQASGMLFRAFSTRSKAFILKLYVAYVRPILEYTSVAWNPIGIGLESDLEKVQQTFTKRLYGSNSMDYESRLKHLKLEKLSSRRRRVDLEMVYNKHGVFAISADSIGVHLQQKISTRSNGIDLVMHRPKTNYITKGFKYRVCEPWNKLPVAVKASNSLKVFKARLKIVIP